MKKFLAIKIGGSMLSKSEEVLFDFDYARKIRNLLKEVALEGYFIGINIGGGYITRKYQNLARTHGEGDEIDLHKLGITTTNVNAQIFHGLFGAEIYPEVIKYKEYDEFMSGKLNLDLENYKFLLVTASKPGISNDWNATQLGLRLGTKTIIDIKNIDGVYTADPKKDPNAKKIDRLTWDEYFDVIGNPKEFEPGGNYPVDIETARLAKENGVKFLIIGGEDFQNIKNAMLGQEFNGTIIE